MTELIKGIRKQVFCTFWSNSNPRWLPWPPILWLCM